MTDNKKCSVVALSAYLAREACGLDDNEAVTLNIGAEAVRKLALAAVKERDRLRAAGAAGLIEGE